jgi:hypothetical protein
MNRARWSRLAEAWPGSPNLLEFVTDASARSVVGRWSNASESTALATYGVGIHCGRGLPNCSRLLGILTFTLLEQQIHANKMKGSGTQQLCTLLAYPCLYPTPGAPRRCSHTPQEGRPHPSAHLAHRRGGWCVTGAYSGRAAKLYRAPSCSFSTSISRKSRRRSSGFSRHPGVLYI